MPWRTVLIGAMALGLSDALAQMLLPSPRWVPALGAPWLIAAFIIASGGRSRSEAAAAGMVAIAGGTALYYMMMVAHTGDWRALGPIAIGWMLAAVPIGGLFGVAGRWWRSGRPFLGLSLLGAGLWGECLVLALVWPAEAWPFLVVEAFIGAGVLIAAWRSRINHARWYSPALVRVSFIMGLALVMAGSEASVRAILRITGWGGL